MDSRVRYLGEVATLAEALQKDRNVTCQVLSDFIIFFGLSSSCLTKNVSSNWSCEIECSHYMVKMRFRNAIFQNEHSKCRFKIDMQILTDRI